MPAPVDTVKEALFRRLGVSPQGIPGQIYDKETARGNWPQKLNPESFLGVVPGSNYERDPLYRGPGLPVEGFQRPTSYNYRGLTFGPSNVQWILDHQAATHAHELAHAEQNLANRRLGGEDFSQSRNPSTLGRQFEVVQRLQSALGWGSTKELLARLRGQEAMMPEGQHIWDHPEVKEHVKTEADKRILQELMFPETTFASQGEDSRSAIRQFLDPNNKLDFLGR